MTKIRDVMSKHQTVLADVLEKVPEQAKEAIQNVMERSQKGHDTAMEAVGGAKETSVQNDNVPKNPGSQVTTTSQSTRVLPLQKTPEF